MTAGLTILSLLVVERSPFRGFAADYQLLRNLGFNLIPS
nr:MAG TPA: hypothetical protein [Caudoviricetes sp.]